MPLGDISERWNKWLATQDSPPQATNHVHASTLDDLCYRRVVYQVVCPEKEASPEAGLLPIFWMGRTLQTAWVPVLNAIGYEVVEQMSSRVWPAYNLSGSADYRLKCPDGQIRVSEFKTIGHTFSSINEPKDCLKLRMPYHAWYGQLQCYCVLYGVEEIVFILQEKLSGAVKDWVEPLDYAYADVLTEKATELSMWAESYSQDHDALPPRIADPRECERCRFGHICLPDWTPKEADFIDEPALIEALQRYEELKPATEERDDLRELISSFVPEGKSVLTSKWLLRKTWTPPQTSIPKARGGFWKLNIRKQGE